jgi:hypothetical protein
MNNGFPLSNFRLTTSSICTLDGKDKKDAAKETSSQTMDNSIKFPTKSL